MRWLRYHGWFVFGGILLVVAIVMLVIAITQDDDPGFVNPDNRWAYVPISVRCENYDGSAARCERVVEAIDAINDRVGVELFLYQELAPAADPGSADIDVTIGVPQSVVESNGHDVSPRHRGGFSVLTGENQIYTHCGVQTSNSGNDEMAFLVLYHELGCHCLGLAHDESDESICRPVQRPSESLAGRAWLNDHDRQLLRDKYGPE